MTAPDPSPAPAPGDRPAGVSKPARRSANLRAAMGRCLPRVAPWEGVVFRSVTPRYARSADLLSGVGSRRFGGRWNPVGSVNTVYASLDPESAMREALSHYRYYRIPEADAMPRVFVAVRVVLSRALDLRVPDVRRTLRVSLERMAGHDWRRAQRRNAESLTQALGLAASDLGLHALLVPAATGGSNIVVFPGNLGSGCVLEVVRPWNPDAPA